MKKSQLKNIIKESIKSLMNEQSANWRVCKVAGCNNGFGGIYKMTIDGQSPSAGDVFQTPYSGIGTGTLQGVMIVRESYPVGVPHSNSQAQGSPRQFSSYTGPDCCPQACWHSTQNPPPSTTILTGWGTPAYFTVYGVDPNPYVPGPNGMNGGCSSNTGPNCVSYGSQPPSVFDCYACDNGQIITGAGFTNANNQGICNQGGQPQPALTYYDSQSHPALSNCGQNPTGPCPGCNSGQHTWGNMQSWMTNFETNMQNAPWFNNANQPCQFLQNRISLWTNTQNGIANCQTSAQYNILACKIKHVQVTLQPQYNC